MCPYFGRLISILYYTYDNDDDDDDDDDTSIS